ncbi:ABC transporter permease [Microvirga pudoricolor]|uniref:ABC transporter permease n=1 Tax=Microvirga pudoricolor TaxID=2778729 RepID=UPI001951ADFB|nr:ABC transporter permease [Microvirga pudoricolor]MBM6594282.1 ABC transporter permease [Microvirga pudoricolor]
MLRLIATRLLSLAITLMAVSLAIFLILEVLPGDPAAIMLGTAAREDTLAALRLEMGLDRPALVRYLEWVGGILHGDLGTSFTYKLPVSTLVAERLAITVPLSLLAILISTALALPLGVAAAAKRDGPVDKAVLVFSQLGVAVPNFWIGLLFILFFSTYLGWFPAGGFPGWAGGIVPAFKALLLPAVALALPQAAVLTRVTRSATLEVIGADFVRTARAKGVDRSATLRRHVVPNALIPVTTILGLQLSFFFGGAILVENVFNLPGLGRLAYQALAQRDLIVIKDIVLIFAGIVIVVNFLVDIGYALLDPRLRSRS